MSRRAERSRGTAPFRVLEWRTRLSASRIWDVQRAYYERRGVEAWGSGEVPHYITTNRAAAAAHAEIVFAFLVDRSRLGDPAAEPLTICELGAGPGRFAFHFLSTLERLCNEGGLGQAAFRYILTDGAESNVRFWRGHPRFANFIADGRLDFAHFDLARPGPLKLQASGETIAPAGLRRPLVAIANYVLDSVPQDLIRFSSGKATQCLISLGTASEPAEDLAEDPANLLAQLITRFDEAPIEAGSYSDLELGDLLESCAAALDDSYVVLPVAGLRAFDYLAGLSRAGAVLLASDAGEHRLAAMDGLELPAIGLHGSISFWVNFHALARRCEDRGGLALLPARSPRHLQTVALLAIEHAGAHAATRNAYRQHVDEFGPDDFYEVSRHGWASAATMSAGSILGFLRLSRDDSDQFLAFLPRLLELAESLDSNDAAELVEATERIWSGYFPIGETRDLAAGIAALRYAVDDYEGALRFFARSIALYGRDSGTLTNMAACHHLLGSDAEASELLAEVLRHDPGNEAAAELMAEYAAAVPALAMASA